MTQTQRLQQITDEVEVAGQLIRTANRVLDRAMRGLQAALTSAEYGQEDADAQR